MKFFLIMMLIIISLYFADRICLWLERRGWLYYRRKKPESSILGNAFLDLQTILNPSAQYIIEMKQKENVVMKNEAEAPTDESK